MGKSLGWVTLQLLCVPVKNTLMHESSDCFFLFLFYREKGKSYTKRQSDVYEATYKEDPTSIQSNQRWSVVHGRPRRMMWLPEQWKSSSNRNLSFLQPAPLRCAERTDGSSWWLLLLLWRCPADQKCPQLQIKTWTVFTCSIVPWTILVYSYNIQKRAHDHSGQSPVTDGYKTFINVL